MRKVDAGDLGRQLEEQAHSAPICGRNICLYRCARYYFKRRLCVHLKHAPAGCRRRCSVGGQEQRKASAALVRAAAEGRRQQELQHLNTCVEAGAPDTHAHR